MKSNVVFLVVSLLVPTSAAQDMDRMSRPMATLTDSSQIRAMLQELLIAEPGPVHRADVIDITANGFGPDDLVLLYPSMSAYLVDSDVPRMLQDAMKTWSIDDDYRVDATRASTAGLAQDAHRRRDARAALTSAVLASVAHYYTGDTFDLRVKRDTGGVRVDLWNYAADSLRFVEQPPRGTQFVFGKPRIVPAFKDPGSCVHAYTQGDAVLTRPCPPAH